MLLMDGLSGILRSRLVGKERGIASWFVCHAPLIVSPPPSVTGKSVYIELLYPTKVW